MLHTNATLYEFLDIVDRIKSKAVCLHREDELERLIPYIHNLLGLEGDLWHFQVKLCMFTFPTPLTKI